ncbi:MAG: EAL domain-containing protein [Rhodoferax sp.]|jgi:diguanylate cyclase (GGDEF)-like protein/PAS domain S-box-containing protein|nr:EAL domain-containing protein [Rhodoferax sp.]
MLGLFARFVGRLPVGRKLLLIYLLDLSAVIYVSGILINEKYIAINFARKEVAGSAYIAEVRDVLTALPVPIVPDAAGKARASVPEPLQLDRWTRLLAQVEQQHGEGMASQDTSMELIQQLQKLAGRATLDKPLYYAIQDAGRELITRLGNQSNLILDPDLDSYYTMSLLVLRFPELQDLIGRLAGQSVEYAASSGEARTVLLNEMLISEGRLAATIKGIKSDYAEALAAGPAKLRADLAPGFTTLFAALEQFQLKTGYRGMTANPLDATAVAQLHQDTRAPMVRAWRQTSVSLDGMLSARISHLLSRMWLHLGTAAMLLLIILALVYFIARQIARPIRSLAGVADEVSRSGDYSVRATHDSRDEIGQLVTAFNSMLGELDLERAAREDLAATARAQEAQRALLESFPTPLIVTSIPEHRILHANQPAGAWLDGQTDDPWVKALSPAARAHYFQRMSDEDAVDGFEVQWQTGVQANGTPIRRWALLSGRRLTYQGAPAMLTAFTPIGQIKQLEQRLQLWAKVFEASSEAIAIFSVDRRLQIANMAFAKAGGWELSEVAGRTPEFLYSTHHENSFYEGVWQSTIIRGSWQGDVWLRRKNGSDYPAWMVANAVRDSTGQITHMVTSCVDVTEHKANEARIHHLAHHDGLTDLPNRSLCLERLTMALEQAARKQTPVAVVFIDLDRFKNINDSMGHHVGDGLLRSVAKRLLDSVRAGDTVSRLGGDEFVVVLQGASNSDEIMDIVADRLVVAIRQPHMVEGVDLHVSCSAGIAVYPQDGHDVDHLMRHADAAMYQAKARGRNMAMFFTPEFHAQAQERLWIENALRQVIAREELHLHYQPLLDSASDAVLGVEVLVRWQHPERGAIPPSTFIPIAEESGQIVAIGAWILEEACRQQAEWRHQGMGTVMVSVNVSSIQLRDVALPQILTQVLERHGVEPAMVQLELTESFLMENALATVESLQRLKAIGVTLAIDDFGTGYSSLNYLHRFPIDKLKIDQSFVRDMLQDPADRAITQAIIGLGHALGMRVVAEGVEHEAEAELLRQSGCDELQGYLFARPMSAADLQTWLGSHRIGLATTPDGRTSEAAGSIAPEP